MDEQTLHISSVYASTNLFDEDTTFIKTNLQLDFPGPWCFIGNSYDVLGAHEVRCSTLALKVADDDFKTFSDANSLTLIMIRGAEYTWCNARTEVAQTDKRLHRSI